VEGREVQAGGEGGAPLIGHWEECSLAEIRERYTMADLAMEPFWQRLVDNYLAAVDRYGEDEVERMIAEMGKEGGGDD
jgi:hypothetical protein